MKRRVLLGTLALAVVLMPTSGTAASHKAKLSSDLENQLMMPTSDPTVDVIMVRRGAFTDNTAQLAALGVEIRATYDAAPAMLVRLPASKLRDLARQTGAYIMPNRKVFAALGDPSHIQQTTWLPAETEVGAPEFVGRRLPSHSDHIDGIDAVEAHVSDI